MIEIPLWFIIFAILAIGIGILFAIHEKYGETIANMAFEIYMIIFVIGVLIIIMVYIQNIFDGIIFFINLIRVILPDVKVVI